MAGCGVEGEWGRVVVVVGWAMCVRAHALHGVIRWVDGRVVWRGAAMDVGGRRAHGGRGVAAGGGCGRGVSHEW